MSFMTNAFDSNVVIYALSDAPLKSKAAQFLIEQGGIISVQVLNEVAAIASRKMSKPWPVIGAELDIIRALCEVVPLTVETHDMGRHIAQRYKLSFYDSLIVAAAVLANCDILYSEEMQDGLKIGQNLSIQNPFQTIP
jgi:predicted nucleic acid-binding protein